MEPWTVILLVVIGLGLIIVLGKALIVGTLFFLDGAGKAGVIGLAVFIGAWVLAFPVMLILSIEAGIYVTCRDLWNERQMRLAKQRKRETRRGDSWSERHMRLAARRMRLRYITAPLCSIKDDSAPNTPMQRQ